MPNRLSSIRVLRLSLVGKPATRKRWLVMKAEGAGDLAIFKADEERRLLYGVVYSPDEVDSQYDTVDALELEKAAHQFLKDMRDGAAYVDVNHDDRPTDVDVVESYIAPKDFSYEGGAETVKRGSWIAVVHARSPETWAMIKTSLAGFSMAGHGKRTVEKAEHSVPSFRPGEETLDEYKARLKKWQDDLMARMDKLMGRTETTMADDFERLSKVDDAATEPVNPGKRIRHLLADWLVKHQNALRKDATYELPGGFRTVYEAHRLMVGYNMTESKFTPLMKSAESVPHLAALILDEI